MPDTHTGQANDDLDLLRLFERLFSFFRKYGKLIATCSFMGIVAGFLYYTFSPRQYVSTMLVHTYTLSNTEQIRIIANWNNLLKNSEYDVLSSHFNCDPAIFRSVNKITAYEIQKLYIPNNPNGFIIEVTVTDNSVLLPLGTGIVHGLENTNYIKAKLASRRSNLTELISKVKQEIIKLDSTKKNIEYAINNNRQSASYIIDVSNINSQVISLNEKLLGYEDELKFTNAVQVLHKFEKFKKPASPKLLKSIILGFITGFAIGYMLAIYFFLRNRVTLSRVERN
jgi:hypothetical protein